VPFRLPAGSRQGNPLWYLTRLRAAVHFAPRVSGKFLLTADVNGATVAQIPLVVAARSIRVEELGLIGGRRSRTVAGREANVDFRNYVQISGIRPGANVLRFAIEPVAVRGLSRPGAFVVAVLSGSGMEATHVLPDELLLSAEPAAVTAPVGQEVRLGYWLRRRGGRPDVPTIVRLGGGGLDIKGADVQRLPRLGTGVHGAFTVVGREPGTYMVMIAVPDRYNEPSTAVTVTITAPASGTAGVGPGPARFVGAGVLVLAGLALLIGGRRRVRSRRPAIPDPERN
jgi:hypothetical protein